MRCSHCLRSGTGTREGWGRKGAGLTTRNEVWVGAEPHKVFLVDVAPKAAEAQPIGHTPQLQLAVGGAEGEMCC